MEQILTPAIDYAEKGFPVSEFSAFIWKKSEQLIKDASPNGSEILKKISGAKDGSRAPGPGEIMNNPDEGAVRPRLARQKKTC